METKSKVKVVKKTEAGAVASVPAKPIAARQAAREMVSTMSDWVTEFKLRKGEETKAAIEKFLPRQPSPSES